jgi:hypothetical protein
VIGCKLVTRDAKRLKGVVTRDGHVRLVHGNRGRRFLLKGYAIERGNEGIGYPGFGKRKHLLEKL